MCDARPACAHDLIIFLLARFFRLLWWRVGTRAAVAHFCAARAACRTQATAACSGGAATLSVWIISFSFLGILEFFAFSIFFSFRFFGALRGAVSGHFRIFCFFDIFFFLFSFFQFWEFYFFRGEPARNFLDKV